MNKLVPHSHNIKRVIKRALKWLWPSWVEALIVFIINLGLFFKHLSRLNKYTNVVLLTEGGYGHTISDLDMARRVFPSGFTLVIFSSPKRHNWEISKMWEGCNVIHFWLYLYVRDPLWIRRTVLVVTLLLRRIVNRKFWRAYDDAALTDFPEYQALCESQFLIEAYKDLAKSRWGLKLDGKALNQDDEIYFALDVFYDGLSPPRPPARVEQDFRSRLRQIRPQAKGFLTLYMRDKGNDIRCGGEFSDYREMIEMVLRHGLAVLIVGDRPRETAPGDLKSILIDHKVLGIGKEWFENCALVLCDYFIGDAGGGVYLPALRDMPKLMINSAPYAQVVPGFLHLYKRIIDSEGNAIPLEACFNEMTWTYDVGPNHVWRNNTPFELREATQELLNVPPADWRRHISESSVPGVPRFDGTGFRLCALQAAEIVGNERPCRL